MAKCIAFRTALERLELVAVHHGADGVWAEVISVCRNLTVAAEDADQHFACSWQLRCILTTWHLLENAQYISDLLGRGSVVVFGLKEHCRDSYPWLVNICTIKNHLSNLSMMYRS